jgi:hypothetical protein
MSRLGRRRRCSTTHICFSSTSVSGPSGGWALACRYCCKSPKWPGANFLAVKKSDRRPPIDVTPITLPRSPASLSSGNEVPHIFTRKSRVQPKEILITSAKRLCNKTCQLRTHAPQQTAFFSRRLTGSSLDGEDVAFARHTLQRLSSTIGKAQA